MAKRLFVSVDLGGLADELRAVQDRFAGASGLRLTDPEQAHVTLKFLGDTDPDRVDDLLAELAAAVNGPRWRERAGPARRRDRDS